MIAANTTNELPAAIAARLDNPTNCATAQRIWREYASPELRAFVMLDPEGLGTAMVALNFIALALGNERKALPCVRQGWVRTHAVRDGVRERMFQDVLGQ